MFETLQSALESFSEHLRKSSLKDDTFGLVNNTIPLYERRIYESKLSDFSDYINNIVLRELTEEEEKEFEGLQANLVKVFDNLSKYIVTKLSGNAINSANNYSDRVFALYTLETIIVYAKEEFQKYENTESAEELQKRLNEKKEKIKSLESQFVKQTEKISDLDKQISKINEAYEASLQMPVSMQELEEANNSVKTIKSSADEANTSIQNLEKESNKIYNELLNKEKKAGEIVAFSQNALSMSTSVGLAKSFVERRDKIGTESNCWLGLLIGSLSVAVVLGIWRINALLDLLTAQNFSLGVMFSNLILSILICFPAFWVAWFSTHRLGNLFKLKEDYAYKAAIAISFEGYREQAANHDRNMEAQVLSSVLDRFQEAPLRLINDLGTNSPVSEIVSALKDIPSEIYNKFNSHVNPKYIEDQQSSMDQSNDNQPHQ